jgi:hypothetical protein
VVSPSAVLVKLRMMCSFAVGESCGVMLGMQVVRPQPHKGLVTSEETLRGADAGPERSAREVSTSSTNDKLDQRQARPTTSSTNGISTTDKLDQRRQHACG